MPSVNFSTSKLVGWAQVSDSAETQNDHGPVAVNHSNGTMCSVWNHGTTNRTVKARIFQASANGVETLSPILTISTPGTSIYAGGEDCAKPWVIGVADGSFFIFHVRYNKGGTDSRVEATRVYLLNGVWTVQNASAGIGFLIDSTVTYGAGDVHPRACWVTGNKFYLAYVHETSNNGAGTRAYTVRSGLFTWTNFASPPSQTASKNYTGIPMNDGGGFTISTGGYILPTCCVNRRGDVVLAFEERSGTSPNFTSTIRVKRLSGVSHTSPLTEIEAVAESSAVGNSVAYRRPMVSCPHPEIVHSVGPYANGTSNQVYLAYGEENATITSSVMRFRELRFDAGAACSFNAVTWPVNTGINATADQVSKGSCVYGPTIKVAFGVAQPDGSGNGKRIMCCHSDGVAEDLCLPGANWPDRPDARCLSLDGVNHMALVVESADANSSDVDKFVYLFRIQ